MPFVTWYFASFLSYEEKRFNTKQNFKDFAIQAPYKHKQTLFTLFSVKIRSFLKYSMCSTTHKYIHHKETIPQALHTIFVQHDDVHSYSSGNKKDFHAQQIDTITNGAKHRRCPVSPCTTHYPFVLFYSVSGAHLAYELLTWYVKMWYLILYQIVSCLSTNREVIKHHNSHCLKTNTSDNPVFLAFE